MNIFVWGFWDGETLMPIGFHRDREVAKKEALRVSTNFGDTIMIQMWNEFEEGVKDSDDTPMAAFRRGEEVDLKGLTT